MTQESISQTVAVSAITIANAAELTAAVIHRIAGKDISNSFNGETLTRESVQNLAISRLRTLVSQDIGK